jgi:hypothetical protein
MARQRFPNLTIIDEEDLRDRDTSPFSNSLITVVPDSIADAINHYDLAEAIQQQFHTDITVEDISSYVPGYFLHIGSHPV